MATTQADVVLRHVRALAAQHDDPTPDEQLLQRFVAGRDWTAFEAILRRHGPTVLGVCRRLLRREQDVEDVFQATFLVLARKAASIRRRQSVASWLHGVARRIAVRVRAGATRQANGPVAEIAAPDFDPAGALTWNDVRGALDEELSRLPETLRAPLVLCYLEGLARDEAAARLGCPLGTLKGRLERGRELLRRRLTRRGLGLGTALAALALERAVVPAALAAATVRAASGFAAGAPGGSAATALAAAALREMTGTRLKAVAALLLGLTVLASGTGLLVQSLAGPKPPAAEIENGQVAAADESKKTDAQGDSLPPGAVARLGTVRYRFAPVGAAFLPDGKTVVSVDQGSAIKLWDARTGRLVREIDTGNLLIGTARGLSLSADGKRVAVNGWTRDGAKPGSRLAARVFDLATGKDLLTVELLPLEGINALTLTPDGKLLFTLDRKGRLRVTEVDTGAELLRQQFPGDVMAALAMSPDGSTVAVGSGPNTHKILVWRWQAAEEPREIKTADRYRARDLAFSPDGKLIADCSDLESDVRVWDVHSGRLLHKLELPDHEPYLHLHVTFSPDGKLLAAYGLSNRRSAVHLWDPATGRFAQRLDLGGGVLAFSPDGNLLLAGSRVWDLAAGKELSANDAAHSAPIHEVAVVVQEVVVTVGGDSTARLWDAATGKHLRRLAHDDWVGGVALSHDGRQLVSGSSDEINLWDVATAKRIYRLPGHGRLGSVARPVVFTPDDKSFLSWGPDMRLRKWDVRTGKAMAEHVIRLPGVRVPSEDDEPFDRQREMLMFTLGGGHFTPDGKCLVLDVRDKWLIFDTATGKELRSFPKEDGTQIGTAISGDSKLILATAYGKSVPVKLPDGSTGGTAPKDHSVAWWDLATGERRKEISLPEEGPGPVAFSPDGTQFAVASSRPGSLIRVMDTATGRELRKIEGVRGVVRSLAFMPDGKRLISGMEDSSALVWDLER
jgi:RNA polymerase sigma factor (sigma-70 family)